MPGISRGVAACAVAASLALTVAAGGAAAQDQGVPVRKRTTYDDLQMFSQVLNQLRVNHPDSLDSHDLIMGAILGMLNVADPHSYVVRAQRLEPGKERALREGKLYPVPISFALLAGTPVVVSVAPGSAAARQGILPGDELFAIDGRPVTAESVFELDVILAGAKHSTVALTFRRQRSDGTASTVERRVRRERTEEASAVAAAFMWDASTGYVRITTFASPRAAEDLRATLQELERRGMKRLLLDLRDNSGGFVSEAAAAAGVFLPEGSLVFVQEGRKQELLDTIRVSRSLAERGRPYPMIVLINAGTASAAELVAGALQDHDRALIVGQPSFGKALLLRPFPLTDGSIAVLVVGHVKTPCGRIIQRRYRGAARRSYLAVTAERDTVGRPWCRTRNGRVVYGGGGIIPDVALPTADVPPPSWLSQLSADGLLLRWTPGHVSNAATAYPSLEHFSELPSVAPEAVADFRQFAATSGVALPLGDDVDTIIAHAIALSVAYAKWSDTGFYTVLARLDGDIARAARAFADAEAMLKPFPP